MDESPPRPPKGKYGYIVKMTNGDTVVFFADSLKKAREKCAKLHTGTIATIRKSKKKRD